MGWEVQGKNMNNPWGTRPRKLIPPRCPVSQPLPIFHQGLLQPGSRDLTLATGFSPVPGISKPGPRDYEVTDSQGPGGKGKWTKPEVGGGVPGTPSSELASFLPSSTLKGLLLLPLSLTRTSDQLLCLESWARARSGEGGKDGRVYYHPFISTSGLLDQCKASSTGFLPVWRLSLLRLLQARVSAPSVQPVLGGAQGLLGKSQGTELG